MDICCPQSQEEIHCLGQMHHAQGLDLLGSYQSSITLNSLLHNALMCSFLGVIGEILSAGSLHSDFSIRVEMEFPISNSDGEKLLGALFNGDDSWLFTHNQ